MTVKQLPGVQLRHPGRTAIQKCLISLVFPRASGLCSQNAQYAIFRPLALARYLPFRTFDPFPKGSAVPAVPKEDMGRGFTVFGRFLRRTTLCYYLGSAMVLALAGLVAVLTFTPDANHKDESKEAFAE